MPSYEYLEMKSRHPDWVWPRSDSHMVLGVPGSMECYKTWVEPGNSFSPGISSFGVSVWVRDLDSGALYMPERMDIGAFDWSFREGMLPIVISEWDIGGAHVQSRLFTMEEAPHVYSDTLRVRLSSGSQARLRVYLVLRSYGACGGRIESVRACGDYKNIELNDFPLIFSHQRYDAFAAVDCYGEERDIGEYITRNDWPDTLRAADKHGWCSAAARYDVTLAPGEVRELSWVFPIYLPKTTASQLVDFVPPLPLSAQQREERVAETWRGILSPLEVEVADGQFRDMLYATLLHMLMMVTGDDVRIETSFYPLFWLRDGVYIINALDKAGHQDMARRAMKRLVAGDFYGGFGSEADAPAEGIWALAQHFLFTGDAGWLRSVYPAIERKAAWIERMMRAEETLYDYSTEMVTSFIRASMVSGLVCHPAKDGLIQGNMDHHIPLYWINCWAVCGLRLAAACAQSLGESRDSGHYAALADELHKNLVDHYPDGFRETPELQGIYSFGVALWPSRALSAELVRDEFDIWWREWRCPDGAYNVAWDWSYFECAQAHNYLLLGEWQRYETILNRFRQHQDVPGLYGYNEGKRTTKADGTATYGGQDWGFGNTLPYRGWDRFDCNMPHNWTGSELFLMMRDALLYEHEGELVVGAGILRDWLADGKPVAVKRAPSHFGDVGYRVFVEGDMLRFELDCAGAGRVRLWIPSMGVDERYEGGAIRAEIKMAGRRAQ